VGVTLQQGKWVFERWRNVGFSVLGQAARWLVRCVLAVSLLGLLAGAFGRYSTDLDLLANARGHLIGIAAFAGLALWLDYRPVVVLGLGAFLTLATHALLAQQYAGPLFSIANAAPVAGAGAWTVLSLNSWHNHPDPAALSDFLTDANADVLVLTEFGPNKIAELHTLEKTYPYRVECAAQWECAIAVLSRHPFTSSGSNPEGARGPAMAWVTFGAGEQAFTVMGVHVAGPLRSSAVHARELFSLAGTVRGFSGKIVVAGDFNTTPWTSAFARFGEVSHLAHMGRFLPSYPAGTKGLPQLAIDHMFASPSLRFDDVWLGPDVGSDHRPVLANVQLPQTVVSALP